MIRAGIYGYGNVARGAEKAIAAASDMELRAIFTRRDTSEIKPLKASTPVYDALAAEAMQDEIDVMLLCGSTATDLSRQGPRMAALYNTVDSFDTHAKIPEYLAAMNAAASSTTAIISSGWDPGLFSMIRALSDVCLPDGAAYTFWGPGVSQGHSSAVRSIEGVKRAVQYSIPKQGAIEAIRTGDRPELSPRQKHLRECYVVAEAGADKTAIETSIKTMPDYFADYDTVVHFISDEEFSAGHMKMPHGGKVIHTGKTGGNAHTIEYSLNLESNPEFTGSVMTAFARAAVRFAGEGAFGAKTPLDIPLAYLSPKDRLELIKELV